MVIVGGRLRDPGVGSWCLMSRGRRRASCGHWIISGRGGFLESVVKYGHRWGAGSPPAVGPCRLCRLSPQLSGDVSWSCYAGRMHGWIYAGVGAVAIALAGGVAAAPAAAEAAAPAAAAPAAPAAAAPAAPAAAAPMRASTGGAVVVVDPGGGGGQPGRGAREPELDRRLASYKASLDKMKDAAARGRARVELRDEVLRGLMDEYLYAQVAERRWGSRSSRRTWTGPWPKSSSRTT